MENKKFNLWNNIVALAVLFVASFTYLSTIEPSASFWDCGEFIASSYKLEVGHPPGNPVFQLIARFFTIFVDASHAAIAVNAMSAMCSAFTIYFLYLTIVFFAKRLASRQADGTFSKGAAAAIFGSGIIGALAYCFSDTFWFSAVEGEVYAMSSLFTAVVFWAMTRWYEQADRPHANRWIVLIAFLMGLSIGVHLLNLLTIPAIVFMFYYRRREDGQYSFKEFIGIFMLSIVILGLIFFILVPYIPKMAAYTDLFFVNVLHCPVNTGAAVFGTGIIGLCFWGLFKTYDKGKVLLNTSLLCLTSILIGFSIFSIIIIRSTVKTPTNENQPDNAFSLVRYLSREQYGKTPLVYGQYFDAPYNELKQTTYWALVNGKYKSVKGPVEPVYAPEGKMFFPRMWSNASDNHIKFYQLYTEGKGIPVMGADYRKPTFWTNLGFFFDFQVGWMYWRYFMWNFVGRQNEIHSPQPGELFYGNWESGIRPIDEFRLGDQSMAPEPLRDNKGKNHYFFLPLILGIIGLCYQFDKDKRGCWVTFILFFLTGLAIVIYLNQPPLQVRERDYAYAGSFYAFAMWIGFAVMALHELAGWLFKKENALGTAVACTLVCMAAPAIMAQQNWDDHDRSNRRTAVEMAANYLNSVGPNGILITHGDNDTFPLWYAQEVESVRPDIRICNTSLLGTDWHIDQMKYAINDSPALDLQIGAEQYLYGTNEYVVINDTQDKVVPISIVMQVFRDPKYKVQLRDGTSADYIMSRKISVPVNKANVIAAGILPPGSEEWMSDEIILTMPEGKNYVSKPELFLLDLLSGYQWDRPIHMLSLGGDLNIGEKPYLMNCGFSHVLVPVKSFPHSDNEAQKKYYADNLYNLMTRVYRWDALKRTDYFVDYQNLYTFLGVMPQRELFYKSAKAAMEVGEYQRALELLDKGTDCVPEKIFPLETACIGFSQNDITIAYTIETYFTLSKKLQEVADSGEDCAYDAAALAATALEHGRALGGRFNVALTESMLFYAGYREYDSSQTFEFCCQIAFFVSDLYKEYGCEEEQAQIEKAISVLMEES